MADFTTFGSKKKIEQTEEKRSVGPVKQGFLFSWPKHCFLFVFSCKREEKIELRRKKKRRDDLRFNQYFSVRWDRCTIAFNFPLVLVPHSLVFEPDDKWGQHKFLL